MYPPSGFLKGPESAFRFTEACGDAAHAIPWAVATIWQQGCGDIAVIQWPGSKSVTVVIGTASGTTENSMS
jgi:hypothetical protein